MIIAWITSQLAGLNVPQRLREPLAWVMIALTALAILWAGYEAWKAVVIRDHETERMTDAIQAYDGAAEQRAADVITGILEDKARVDAINAAPSGGVLPPTTRALNCERFRQAYSARELAKMPAYNEVCK